LPILSNSTNMVHSEQMFALDGPIQIGRSTIGSWQLENHSQLHLRSAALIKKVGDELRGVWIGELEPGRSAAIGDPDRMPKLPRDAPPFAAERQSEARTADSARLNLETLIRLASEGRLMDDGELRLVARVDEPLAGETVLPTASQLRSGTLLVAHLRYGPLPPPQRDRNTKQDVAVADEDELEF
jgi:hypothetical protein